MIPTNPLLFVLEMFLITWKRLLLSAKYFITLEALLRIDWTFYFPQVLEAKHSAFFDA